MTTSVHIAVSGNKQAIVKTEAGETRMQPGSHFTFSVHGDGVIAIREIGPFISAPILPMIRPYQPEDGDEA
ncbi:hypothetical protein [Variovorax paradoxus]|uniref:hypothetical protein n=1 Tax=Variovorax paradoxus TaxID=34073 RepID=UPI00193327DA|nr:hypothetical protein INQ48_20495 [Variovorax paradoxus]